MTTSELMSMNVWSIRAKDLFLQISDDGYVITSELEEVDEEDKSKVVRACGDGEWHACPAIYSLEECIAQHCSCSRHINPAARTCFLRTLVQRITELSEGKQEVTYASLGSGLLRFDFMFLMCLLEASVPVTAVHLVDPMYEADAKHNQHYMVAISQFTSWFSSRGVDVHAHGSMENFAFRVRQAGALPLAVLQIDCAELTVVFDDQVKPMVEEVLQYGGLFCALTAREGARAGSGGCMDAWGELWRLMPESGRLKQVLKARYRPGEMQGKEFGEDQPMPKAVSH